MSIFGVYNLMNDIILFTSGRLEAGRLACETNSVCTILKANLHRDLFACIVINYWKCSFPFSLLHFWNFLTAMSMDSAT